MSISFVKHYECPQVEGNRDKTLEAMGIGRQEYSYFHTAMVSGTRVQLSIDPLITIDPMFLEAALLYNPATMGLVLNLLCSTFSRAQVLETMDFLRSRQKDTPWAILRMKYVEMQMDQRLIGLISVPFLDMPHREVFRMVSVPPMKLDLTPSWAWHFASLVFRDLTSETTQANMDNAFAGKIDPIGMCVAIAMSLRFAPEQKPGEQVMSYVFPGSEDPMYCAKASKSWASKRFSIYHDESRSQLKDIEVQYNFKSSWDLLDVEDDLLSTMYLPAFLAEDLDIHYSLQLSEGLIPYNKEMFKGTAPRNPWFFCKEFPREMTWEAFCATVFPVFFPKGYDRFFGSHMTTKLLDVLVTFFFFRRKARQLGGDWASLYMLYKKPHHICDHSSLTLTRALYPRMCLASHESYHEMILCVERILGEDVLKVMIAKYMQIFSNSEVVIKGTPYEAIRYTDHKVDLRTNKTFSVRSPKAPRVWVLWKSGSEWIERPNMFTDTSACCIVIDTPVAPSLILQSDLAPSWNHSHLPFSGAAYDYEFLNSSSSVDSRFHFPSAKMFAFRFSLLSDQCRHKDASLIGGNRPPFFWLTFRWATGEYLFLPLVSFTRPIFPAKPIRRSIVYRSKNRGGMKSKYAELPMAYINVDGWRGRQKETHVACSPWDQVYDHVCSQEYSAYASLDTDIATYRGGKVFLFGNNDPFFDLRKFATHLGLDKRNATTNASSLLDFTNMDKPRSVAMDVETQLFTSVDTVMAEPSAQEIITTKKTGRGTKRARGADNLRRMKPRRQ